MLGRKMKNQSRLAVLSRQGMQREERAGLVE